MAPCTAGRPNLREHGLLGPAVPALSRRPRRPRRDGHTGRRSRRAADAGCPLRLHRADRGGRGTGIYSDPAGDPRLTIRPTRCYHTLGIANDQAEPWDYFPFHDRDFTERGRADAGAGLPAGAVHQAIRRVRPVADQLGPLRPGPAAVGPAPDHHGVRDRRDGLRDRLDGQPDADPHLPLSRGQILLYRERRARRTRAGRWSAARPATAGSRCSSSSRCPAR